MSFFSAVFGARPESSELKAALQDVQQRPMQSTVVIKSDSRPHATARAEPTHAAPDPESAGVEARPLLQRGEPVPSAEAPGPSDAHPTTAPQPTAISKQRLPPSAALTVLYGVGNLSSVVMIVVANKMVLFTHGFNFVFTLTLLHSIFTAVGMSAMAHAGLFEVKPVQPRHSLQLAAVYVGFIVSNNWSIQVNPLGFYQMSKLAITPVVIAIEWVAYGKAASSRVLASVAILMVGLALCSVTDAQVTSNTKGIIAAISSVLVAALYQIWAGTKQKELGLNGMQLLQQVSPMSVAILVILVPLTEPIGLTNAGPKTILGYHFTNIATFWILISSVLGLVVTLTTFLFIGATSSLTYNIVGHLKTLLVIGAGVFLFGEDMGLKKGLGLAIALGGIVWYTQIKMEEARKPAPTSSKG